MAGTVSVTKKEYLTNLKRCELQITNFATLFGLDQTSIEDLRSYYPTYEEVVETTQAVLDRYIYSTGIEPDGVPKLSLNISPPASGKSNLNEYALEKMGRDKAILINSDEIKTFFLKAKALSSHPKLSVFYSYVTDIFSNIATSVLLNTCIDLRLNFVFEGTGRTNRVLQTIEPVRNIYRIKIRTIAVSPMSSLVSIMGRYTEQRKNGLNGRLVRADDFLQCFSNIPLLLDCAERNLGYHVEVFTRGKNCDTLPIKLYSSNNRQGYHNAVAALQSAREYNGRVSHDENLTRIAEVYKFLTKRNNAENTLILTELINIMYNIMLLDNAPMNDDF